LLHETASAAAIETQPRRRFMRRGQCDRGPRSASPDPL
jgi:hypothetical protein